MCPRIYFKYLIGNILHQHILNNAEGVSNQNCLVRRKSLVDNVKERREAVVGNDALNGGVAACELADKVECSYKTRRKSLHQTWKRNALLVRPNAT